MKKFNIGIIGAGWIAQQMANTLNGTERATQYAIASRSLEKAIEFKEKNGFEVAYGSYEELVADDNIDLVYIATPHSHHYAHTKLALEHGKHVLCEKAFTANAREAEELCRLAKEKGLFLAEAIWTRYMPLSKMVKQAINEGIIGKPATISATLSYNNWEKERMYKSELCGGALLDLGVYVINFALMYFDAPIAKIVSDADIQNGVDTACNISIRFTDGCMASLQSSNMCWDARRGIISGDKGYLIIDNVNNPHTAHIYSADNKLIKVLETPTQITGYEYQVFACQDAISKSLIEAPDMPHSETIRIMKLMDNLRKEWGVVYPNDKQML